MGGDHRCLSVFSVCLDCLATRQVEKVMTRSNLLIGILVLAGCGQESLPTPDFSMQIVPDFQLVEQTQLEKDLPPIPKYAKQGELCDLKTACFPWLICYPATPMKGICTQKCCERGMEGFSCPPCPEKLSCWMGACIPL